MTFAEVTFGVRGRGWLPQILLLAITMCTWFAADNAAAGFPYNPADPRPDIFSRAWHLSHPPYRAIYNRPRYVGGWLAYKIEPTSQEAMSWADNVRAKTYHSHRPTCIPHYNYPKPWEVLQTGARRNLENTTPNSSPISGSVSEGVIQQAIPLHNAPGLNGTHNQQFNPELMGD